VDICTQLAGVRTSYSWRELMCMGTFFRCALIRLLKKIKKVCLTNMETCSANGRCATWYKCSSIVIHKVAVRSQDYDNNGDILRLAKCMLNPSSTNRGWVDRARYIQFVTYMAIPFHSQHSRHILYIDFSACNAILGRDNIARIRSLRIEIDHTNAHVQSKKPRRTHKKTTKTLLRWNENSFFIED
jgi:hypothetical protein